MINPDAGSNRTAVLARHAENMHRLICAIADAKPYACRQEQLLLTIIHNCKAIKDSISWELDEL